MQPSRNMTLSLCLLIGFVISLTDDIHSNTENSLDKTAPAKPNSQK